MSNNNFLLPTGDYLRQLIGQSNIKSNDLKPLLRARGIFSISDDKKVIGPLLIKTGISPYEFIELRDLHITKEESLKYKTRSIEWNSEKRLIDAIPELMEYDNLLDHQFETCSLINAPCFTSQSGNLDHVVMNFEISRKDLTRNWGENTTSHKGRVELKRIDNNPQIFISLTHTSTETKDFANKVVDTVITHFKSNNDVSPEVNIVMIRFGDFTNENRINFFNQLSQTGGAGKLKFTDTKNIHISPINLSATAPKDLVWMKDKIENLKLTGQNLHSTFFITDKSHHQYIQLIGITCDYRFTIDDTSGECHIIFEFSESDGNKINSELTLNISMIKLHINEAGSSKDSIKKQILESLESKKIELYDKYKISI